ncbi:MAG: 3-deoxy-manno-octulosonate cytidylyltransferase [Nitrospina sp.]|mgnify:CR=1 FL=1|jgi:3-deoxy-manno-octulosonate cytidylyltransferase (CMP-KDO synthetase)|nr:3-deoxy-manno-octulosonate cytidylyltransferase [Nitrospina sp.]
MKAIGIIPARLGATRYPNKPMALIHGMPMVEHCYHRTRLTPGIGATYVATCDKEIADYVSSIGGLAVMTSTSHTRATMRTAEAMEKIEAESGEQVDVVVMVQGDEPLISTEAIAETLGHFSNPTVEIVNIMSRLNTYEQFIDKNNVKVVVNHNNDALYFSREPIPSPWQGMEDIPMYMQTGIIAFRRNALQRFNQMEETRLEQIESVDMNRVLETGGQVRMVLTESVTIGVDTPQELKDAEKLMNDDPTLARYLTR